jgi:hypothetical protein
MENEALAALNRDAAKNAEFIIIGISPINPVPVARTLYQPYFPESMKK